MGDLYVDEVGFGRRDETKVKAEFVRWKKKRFNGNSEAGGSCDMCEGVADLVVASEHRIAAKHFAAVKVMMRRRLFAADADGGEVVGRWKEKKMTKSEAEEVIGEGEAIRCRQCVEPSGGVFDFGGVEASRGDGVAVVVYEGCFLNFSNERALEFVEGGRIRAYDGCCEGGKVVVLEKCWLFSDSEDFVEAVSN